jgi:hypothetical protein
MAVDKIDGIYLYSNIDWLDYDNPKNADCKEVKKFLEDNNIDFIFLNYADPIQHEEALKPLRGWDFKDGKYNFTVNSFPFLMYTEIDYNTSMYHWKKVLLVGKDAILNSNLLELSKLGR